MGGSKPAENKTLETELSKEQAAIAKDRNTFFNDFTVPELKEHLETVKNTQFSDDLRFNDNMPMLSNQVSDIRDQYKFQQNQMSNNLAKRGLEGSGVEANSLSQLGSAEAGSISGAVNQASIQSLLQQNELIDLQNSNKTNQNQIYGSAIGSMMQLAPRPSSATQQQLVDGIGEKSPWGATLGGGIQGASVGGQAGGPWGALIGGVVGTGSGYASAT